MFDSLQVFITFRCSGNCPYCIQGGINRNVYNEVEPNQWIEYISSMPIDRVGLIGGEPTLYDGFKELVESLAKTKLVTVTTNLHSKLFEDFGEFVVWARNYNVRWNVSYHPSVISIDRFINLVRTMRINGLWVDQVASVLTPELEFSLKTLCESNIGFWLQTCTYRDSSGVLHPTREELERYGACETYIYDYDRYNFLCGGNKNIDVVCHTGKLLVDPEGDAYRCHRDLYNRDNSIGNVFDQSVHPEMVCHNIGDCNPCDYASIRYWRI